MDTNTAVHTGTAYNAHDVHNARNEHNAHYHVHTYIDVRNGRIILARMRQSDTFYIEENALNWHELEAQAWSALRRMEPPLTGGLYSCPPELARKAIFSDDEEWLPLHEACRVAALSMEDIHSAIKRARLDVKMNLQTSSAEERLMVRRSQVLQVWSLTLYRSV